MSYVKISELPTGTASSTSVLPFVGSGVTQQVTAQSLGQTIGIYTGSGVPTASAVTGSLYLRNDANSAVNTSIYTRYSGGWKLTSARAPAVWPVSKWKSDFDTVMANGESAIATSLSNTLSSEDMYSLAYRGMDGSLSMWRATGSAQYLDTCIQLAKNLISKSTAANTISGNIFTDTYKAWVDTRNQEGGGTREYWLHDIFYWRHVATLLRHMSYNATIMANTGYVSSYNTLFTFLETNIWNKWRSRTSQSLSFDTSHILSHWVLVAMAIQELSQSATNVTDATRTVDQCTYQGMSAGTARTGFSLYDMMSSNPSNVMAYTWREDTNRTGGYPDFGHAGCIFNFAAEQYDRGYVWQAYDMGRLANLIKDVQLADVVPPFTYPQSVDGSGVAGDGWAIDGMGVVGRYDEATQRRLEMHSRQNIVAGNQMYGMGALAAAYLRGEQQP